MTNELYKGDYVHGKKHKKPTYYENVIEGLITKEKWDNCQYQKQRNVRNYERTATYLFTNKLKCMNCGCFLGGKATTKKKTGKKYYYYQCKNCSTNFKEEDIKNALTFSIFELLKQDDLINNYYTPFIKSKVITDDIDYEKEIQNMVTSKVFFESLNEFTCDYKKLEKQYKNSLIDINYLEDQNGKLHEDKTNLLEFINRILLILKQFFRDILLSNDKDKKEKTIDILKECYDINLYNSIDLKEISKDTDSEITINNLLNNEEVEKDYDY